MQPDIDDRGALDAQPSAVRWLRVALVLSLLGPAVLLGFIGFTTHAEATDAARGRLARLTQIAEEQALRIVETNEVISRALTTRIGARSNAEVRESSAELHAVLKAWTADMRQLQSVWVWSEDGRALATNLMPVPPATLDISDREYFAWARSTESTGWFVSAPLRSRTTGELFVDFCKRRSGADGQFLGAISVSLFPAYFEAFFRDQVASEPGLAMSLLRDDGTLIARFPSRSGDDARVLPGSSPLRALIAQRPRAGEMRGISPVDGQDRYVAYRRIGDLPLYAVTSGSRSAMLAPWRRGFAVLAGLTIPLSVWLSLLCWFSMKRVRREHAIALAHRQQYEQRMKAEEALRHAQKMKALGRLTGGVAHDFNNILMVVQTSAVLARQLEERGQPTGRALAPIERAVANGAQLTRQLLAIVRRQPLDVRTVDLQQVIVPLTQLMSSTLGRGVTVVPEVDPGVQVTLDEAELELALINLCINAKDAMPAGGVVRIVARVVPPPAPGSASPTWVRLSVSDPGEGIPPEQLHRVTEPFFTTKPLGQGTGLGLSQVQSFVEQAGGRLEIQSVPGRGTEVAMLLPCTIAVASPPLPAPKALQRLSARLLLVEDNPDVGTAVTAILENAGARVIWHTSADDALAAIASGAEFDVVLSDVSLPGRHNGIDLARQLSSRVPPLPVVLMTGYTDQLQEAVAAGFRVISKPATPEALLDALTESLASSAAASSAVPGAR